MKKEKSCGAVLYKMIDGQRHYLIQHMAKGHYSIPKGHVEGNETEAETALREIKEETNLEVKLDTGFRHVITYSPFPGVTKDVVFFVGEILSDDLIVQKEEVSDCEYLLLEDMKTRLTHASDWETVKEADTYLNTRQ